MGEAVRLLELYDLLPADEKAAVHATVDAILDGRRWIPQEGPQTDAYFSKADEVLFGGAAGGGKSHLLLGYALNEAKEAVIFRNGFGNLRDLENEAVRTMGHRDGFNQQTHYWRLPGDRGLEFSSLEQPGSELNHQGRRRDVMCFDEVTQMVRDRVQFVLGWVTRKVIFATNPPFSDEGNWIITWFAPWLDPMYPRPAKAGELRWFVNNREGDPVWVKGPGEYDRGDGVKSTAKSRTFVPSKLSDNAYLRDTDYRSRVEAMPEPMRSAMLDGNFMASRTDHANQVFPIDWWRAANRRWRSDGGKGAMIALAADVAQGGSDRTALAALHVGNWFAPVVSVEGVNTKDGPAVGALMIQHQRNGAPMAIDMTGGWGGAVKEHLRQAETDVIGLVYSSVSGSVDPQTRIPFGNLRAEMYWNFRLALDPHGVERIAIPIDSKLLAEAATPRWRLQGGKIYIESKDEIRARLGHSPDLLDALVMAWHIRGRGIAKQRGNGAARFGQVTQAAEADPFAVDGY